jgi:hypothetical protein
MLYSITVGKGNRVEAVPDRPYHQLDYKHAASYASKVIRDLENSQDLTMTVWDGVKEAVEVKLLAGTAKVWVDADVYAAKPGETAYIEAAVNNAVQEWRQREVSR